jgi:uncharacterized protein YbjT (DUF2867 family)
MWPGDAGRWVVAGFLTLMGNRRPAAGERSIPSAATCKRGGKEVHSADVAKAVGILLTADGVAGQTYNCCDRYVSEYEVATIARRISGSDSRILGEPTAPRHQIVTAKIRALGMEFGGGPLPEATIARLVEAARG